MENNLFGKLYRENRKRTGQSLREFCNENLFDCGNMSRIETGKHTPANQEILDTLVFALGVKKGSKEYYKFIDYACADKGSLPPDLCKKEILELLPELFGLIRENKISVGILKRLINSVEIETMQL